MDRRKRQCGMPPRPPSPSRGGGGGVPGFEARSRPAPGHLRTLVDGARAARRQSGSGRQRRNILRFQTAPAPYHGYWPRPTTFAGRLNVSFLVGALAAGSVVGVPGLAKHPCGRPHAVHDCSFPGQSRAYLRAGDLPLFVALSGLRWHTRHLRRHVARVQAPSSPDGFGAVAALSRTYRKHAGPLRLAVQDAALSRRKQGFDSPRGHQVASGCSGSSC